MIDEDSVEKALKSIQKACGDAMCKFDEALKKEQNRSFDDVVHDLTEELRYINLINPMPAMTWGVDDMNTLMAGIKEMQEELTEAMWDLWNDTHNPHAQHKDWFYGNCTSNARWSSQKLLDQGLLEQHPEHDFLFRPKK